MINKTFKKISALINELPTYAGDVKDSFVNTILSENNYLSANDVLGIALTVGYALNNESLLKYIRSDAKKVLSDEEANACKIAVSSISMISMYNYFSEQKLKPNIKNISANLSDNNLDKHGIDPTEFDMYCLAAATIFKSSACIQKYSIKLEKTGVSAEAINEIIKIVAVLNAVSTVLEINRLRSFEFLTREENI